MLGNTFRIGWCGIQRTMATQLGGCVTLQSGFKGAMPLASSRANVLNHPVSQISSNSALVSSKQLNSSRDFSLTDRINEELHGPLGQTSRMFAVIHAAGKQRKITVEDIIVLDKPIEANVGDRIRLNKVLLVGGKDFTVVGRPILSASQALVEATVIEKTLSHGKVVFWYRRRDSFRVFKLLKNSLVYLRINRIELSPLANSAET